MSIRKIQNVYTGKVVRLNIESVELPNGRLADLEIIHHPGGAAIVAVDDQSRVCLIRQYRHAGGGWIWELPAGKLEPDEPPLHTAQRELVEEAGRSATRWQPLGTMLSSPGVFDEVIHLFLARDLRATALAHEETELIEVHWLPMTQACRQVLDGEITDAKTAVGLLRAQHALDGEA
ncbi:MAG: NUDIX hydrolase [Steroidobacteraceae bacterium]